MSNFKKISQIMDMPVFSEKSRKKIGEISDVILYSKSMTVAGYIVSLGGFIRISRFLSVQSISKTESHGIWVESISALSSIAEIKKNKQYASFQRQIKGTGIANGGNKIGNISDMLYKAEFGKITHLEVSDGFSEDVLRGRKRININNQIVFGNNNIDTEFKKT
jgi:uncharacterized protein YrrD